MKLSKSMSEFLNKSAELRKDMPKPKGLDSTHSSHHDVQRVGDTLVYTRKPVGSGVTPAPHSKFVTPPAPDLTPAAAGGSKPAAPGDKAPQALPEMNVADRPHPSAYSKPHPQPNGPPKMAWYKRDANKNEVALSSPVGLDHWHNTAVKKSDEGSAPSQSNVVQFKPKPKAPVVAPGGDRIAAALMAQRVKQGAEPSAKAMLTDPKKMDEHFAGFRGNGLSPTMPQPSKQQQSIDSGQRKIETEQQQSSQHSARAKMLADVQARVKANSVQKGMQKSGDGKVLEFKQPLKQPEAQIPAGTSKMEAARLKQEHSKMTSSPAGNGQPQRGKTRHTDPNANGLNHINIDKKRAILPNVVSGQRWQQFKQHRSIARGERAIEAEGQQASQQTARTKMLADLDARLRAKMTKSDLQKSPYLSQGSKLGHEVYDETNQINRKAGRSTSGNQVGTVNQQKWGGSDSYRSSKQQADDVSKIDTKKNKKQPVKVASPEEVAAMNEKIKALHGAMKKN